MWAGLMATYCRGRGVSVEVIDAEAEGLSVSEVADRVGYLKPRLAAIVAYGHQPSASTQIMTAVGRTCSAVKANSPDIPVLLLGGHVAALPERTLREEETDFVASGEGLQTLVGLVEALKSPVAELSSVPGLWYRDAGRLCKNPQAPLLNRLDAEMPGVAWDLLPMSRYRAHNWHCLGQRERQPYAAIYTTLGCPYHCSFCCIQAPFRNESDQEQKAAPNTYRMWTIDNVVKQIDTLVNKYGVRNIKIADEMFVLNKLNVVGICDRLIERNYDLNIWAYTPSIRSKTACWTNSRRRDSTGLPWASRREPTESAPTWISHFPRHRLLFRHPRYSVRRHQRVRDLYLRPARR